MPLQNAAITGQFFGEFRNEAIIAFFGTFGQLEPAGLSHQLVLEQVPSEEDSRSARLAKFSGEEMREPVLSCGIPSQVY